MEVYERYVLIRELVEGLWRKTWGVYGRLLLLPYATTLRSICDERWEIVRWFLMSLTNYVVRTTYQNFISKDASLRIRGQIVSHEGNPEGKNIVNFQREQEPLM